MTYGDVAAPLTHVMTELLTHGKPYAELGGRRAAERYAPAPGFEERAALVLRYRAMVLEYADELGTALTSATGDAEIVRRWAGWLHASVPDRAALPGGRVANADELSNQHPNVLVDLWRQAAVVSVVAREREIRPLLDTINREQELVALKDIGDLMRALFRLDDRYHRVPGWQHLAATLGGRLERADRFRDIEKAYGRTGVVRRFVEWLEPQITPAGYTVDRLGYQPARLAHPGGSEVAEATGALERLVDVLGQESLRAASMRVLLRAHKGVSVQAVRLAGTAGDVSAQAGFRVRAKLFADLVAATRDVHGVVGDGVYAVSYSTVALDALTRAPLADAVGVRRLGEVLDDVDARLSASLTSAARRGDYFTRTGDALVRGQGGVYRVRAAFEPVTEANSPALHRLLGVLRPVARPQVAAADAVARRVAFGEMLAKPGIEITNGEYLERRARRSLERQRAQAGLGALAP